MTSSEDCVSADDTSGGGFRQAVVQVTVLSHHLVLTVVGLQMEGSS